MQSLFEQITFKRPDFLHGVGAGDLHANLGVEVLRAGAGAFASDGEAIAKYQNAECQQV